MAGSRLENTIPLILASTSPRRRALLQQVHVPFKIQKPGYQEGAPEGDPESFVLHASQGKARDVAGRQRGLGWVLAADTVVARGKVVFGKPGDRAQARCMLETLSGRQHEVLTGLCLKQVSSGKEITWVERTRVWMRKIAPEEMEAYLATHEWQDKAGGYGIQGSAGAFVTRIEGCYFNVVGLPLAKLTAILRQQGIRQ